MHIPFQRHRAHPAVEEPVSPIEEMMSIQQRLVRVHSVRQRVARMQWNIRLFSFFVAMLLITVILPASPIRQALGYGGGSALIQATCGTPAQVFAKLLPGETYTMPTKAQLMQLPTPAQKPIALASDVNYDPATNQLCAGGWVALDTRFVHSSPNVQGSTNYDPNAGGNFVTSALSGMMTSFLQWVRDSLQSILDAAVSFGFMLTTPQKLTYGHMDFPRFWRVGEEKCARLKRGGFYGQISADLHERIQATGRSTL